MTAERSLRDIEHELERDLEDLSQIEKALLIAETFREVYGNEWIIEAKADGGFSIKSREKL